MSVVRPLAFTTALLSVMGAAVVGCGHGSGGNDLAPGADLSTGGSDLSTAPDDIGFTDDIGSTVGIACGDTPCPAAAGFVCCTSTQGKTGTCVMAGACGAASFECDGPEDCPPATPYCCVASGVSQCGSTPCAGTTAGGYGMCHATSDCTTVGGVCCPSSAGGPYRLCLISGC